jgi:ATP-dependent helicase/nuclease subunit A
MTTDRQDRYRATHETNRSFAVEASAGTGKTTILVERILQLVLCQGPGEGPLSLSEVCAITFTEKAAGEMKVRLRREFEKRSAGGGREAELARTALRDLETASISTFHSFAVSLLKERPIEAGLDPRFATMDDSESDRFFKEVWEVWLQRVLAGRIPALERALRAGVELDALAELARTLRRHARTAGSYHLQPPMSEDDFEDALRTRILAGQELRNKVIDPRDTLALSLDRTISWLSDPASPDLPKRSGGKGAKAKWRDGSTDVDQVRAFIAEVCAFRESVQSLPEQRILDDLVRWITTDFLSEWNKQKRERGLLDFDDQLALARDLLVGSRAVRREFQRRYAVLLVDEFQDTDSLQLEIVLLLTCTDLRETDFQRLRPEPGRLFLVGDPKQSIYRFRRADIETYLEIAAPERLHALQIERLQLSCNFRSVPRILEFVDTAFAGAMLAPADGGRYQPNYSPFGRGDRGAESQGQAVYVMGDRPDPAADEIQAEEIARRECTRIASLIGRIRGNKEWQIKDSGNWRAPGLGDIAILLPVLTRADILEDALRSAGIPYVLEGGKFYHLRSEVGSAINALRAIANPNDSVALYASLRSIFFGLSDQDLVRAKIEGLLLDYRTEVPAESPLHRPFAILNSLYRMRHERPASETLERLFQATGAREVLTTRGFQSVANLAKLVRTLRSIQAGRPYSQVVDLISAMDDEEQAETESRLMEEKSDALRILSIHKAKGLDFPIVILAGLGFRKLNKAGSFLSSSQGRKQFAVSVNMKGTTVRTAGWESLAKEDTLREDAELVRLLYVGCTRAKDRLVISAQTSGWVPSEDSSSKLVLNGGQTRLAPISNLVSDCLAGRNDIAGCIYPEELGAVVAGLAPAPAESRDWVKIALEQKTELHRLRSETPSSIPFQTPAEHGQELAKDWDSDSALVRAVRLGTAFHEAMERIDFTDPLRISSLCLIVAQGHQLSAAQIEELESMVRLTLGSPMLERVRETLRSGRRTWRELSFVKPLGEAGGIEEGKIDLVFEEPDGCVLVDYKTDSQGAEAGENARNRYTAQVLTYARALGRLGVKVSAAYILWARTGTALEIPLHADAALPGRVPATGSGPIPGEPRG